MKKIVLLSLIASSAIFAETAADMMKGAAASEAKSAVVAEVKEAVTEAVASESNTSEATKEAEAPAEQRP